MQRFENRGISPSLASSGTLNGNSHPEDSFKSKLRASHYAAGLRGNAHNEHASFSQHVPFHAFEKRNISDSELHCRGFGYRNGDTGEKTVKVREREHTSHVHTTMNRSNSYAFLVMILDGIGLSIITGCTLLQVFNEWQKLHRHHYQYNVLSLSMLICGRICQVMGLLLLIGFAFTMEKYPELEKGGMGMLTVGPIFTAIASAMFDSGGLDPHALLNKRMVMTELVELSGILFLDLSFAEASNLLIFLVEIAGYFTSFCPPYANLTSRRW